MKSSLFAVLFAGVAAAPLFAQVDLTGFWHNPTEEDQIERGPGPISGDYLGIPLNEGARMRADSWSSSLITVPERQCIPHPSDYGSSFSDLKMWRDVDTLSQQEIAWHTHISWMAAERSIWMDGRPHPPEYAPHTWQGFSTGRWEGNILTVSTTHLKVGYIRRNGVSRSDRATVTEHFIRNGNVLTWVTIVHDSDTLTEPFIRSRDFTLNSYGIMGPFPCESVQEIERSPGVVPFYLPGKNPFLTEFADKYKIPREAARGGAETMYPEYQKKLRATMSGDQAKSSK